MHLDARSTSEPAAMDLGLVDYEEAWRIQRVTAERRARGEIGDTLLLCEHPPVYTLGTNARETDVLDASCGAIGAAKRRSTARGRSSAT